MSDNQKELNEIVNVHLGKAGDGSVVNPYVTPDSIDKSLLVPVPRHFNRTDYGIEDDNLPFVGFDTWNCYEVSALTDNGYPVSGVVKIVYPCDSRCIVESKSLKLYMNSYNMAKMGKQFIDVVNNIEDQIKKDLSEALECEVDVAMFDYKSDSTFTGSVDGFMWTNIEDRVKVENIKFDHYNEDPAILKVKKAEKDEYFYTSNTLRSNCRVTNQPDWGTVYIYIQGDKTVTPSSLLQYIVSMRKENHFHEEVVECIYKRLYDLLPGASIGVCALYTRRGGIDINPCRATSETVIVDMFADLQDVGIQHAKTAAQ